MSNQAQYITGAVATAGVVGGAYLAYSFYNNYQQSKIPEEWTQVGTLSNIYAYPIKSCAPIILDSAECSILGLRNGWLRDRFFMIVDENLNFITARVYPEMLRIRPSFRSSVLTLEHQGSEPVHVNMAEVVALEKPKTAYVWSVEVPVFDCGQEVSEWLSEIVSDKKDQAFRLVYYAANTARVLRPSTSYYKYGKNDTGALPDETPFNLMNQASVDQLNTRLKTVQVTHANYRPNFVLAGAKPYLEDNWKFVKIGENVFKIIKPCTRCILTTIDPETGFYNKESLETLKSYRMIEDPKARKASGTSPPLGIQLALRSGPGGKVSINDIVYAA